MKIENFKDYLTKAVDTSNTKITPPPINACREITLPTSTSKSTSLDEMIKAIGAVVTDTSFSRDSSSMDAFMQQYIQTKMEAEKSRSLTKTLEFDSMGGAYSRGIRGTVSATAPASPFTASSKLTGSIIIDDDIENSIPSLDKVRLWALEHGYYLTKIEYESTDLSGTNKIKLKGE